MGRAVIGRPALSACRDCRRPLNGSRRRALERHDTPRTHWRCRACEWIFLTRFDAARYAAAVAGIPRDQN
jgi:RNase P subunit RPR2